MLQVARLAPAVLGDAAASVEAFLREQFLPSGAARDRADGPDLYYTVFGLEGLHALQAEAPGQTPAYLAAQGDGHGLDLVHLACLARCWASVAATPGPDVARRILERIEAHRTPDGAYANQPGALQGTIYHGFLALGAYQDLGATLPAAPALAAATLALQSHDGAFANLPDLPTGSTNVTAAAVTLLRHLDHPLPDVGPWLLAQAHVDGGFLAAPRAPIPDLLSTATALHALSTLEVEIGPLTDRCLDFVDTLWTGRGFCGNWTDDAVDAEYTYYALLALGHLSLH